MKLIYDDNAKCLSLYLIFLMHVFISKLTNLSPLSSLVRLLKPREKYTPQQRSRKQRSRDENSRW